MSSFDPSLDYEAIIARQEVATALLGPYIFGLTAQVLLIGVFLALFTAYAQSDLKHHSKKVKAVLWVVLMLILACLGVAMEEVFDTAVSQARSSDELFAGPPQSNILPVLTALTGAVCQGFLLVRAAALIPHRIGRYAFIVVTAASILLALAGATLFSGIGFLYAFEKPLPYIHYTSALALWLWTSAGVDLLISLALAFTLRARIAGFNSRTDGLLKRLIVVALRTAAYTAVISLAGAAVATAFENAHDYHTGTAGFAFWLPLPALHAISLYTTLSSRRAIAAELGQPVSLTSKPNFGTGGSGGVGAVSPQYPISAALPPPPGTTTLQTSSRQTIRLGPLGKIARSMGAEGRSGSGVKTEEARRKSIDFRATRSWNGGGRGGAGARAAPLVVQVQREEQVEYDDYRDFDDDLASASREGRGTRQVSVDIV